MFGRSRTIERLDTMLDDAINGRFTESHYDETELSRLESRFHQYLMMRELQADAARQEREAQRELVTDLSHQMKTPLAALVLYAQMLEEQCTDRNKEQCADRCGGKSTCEHDGQSVWAGDSHYTSADAVHCAQQIRLQAEKLASLTEALIHLSRLETGMVEVVSRVLSVDELVRGSIRLVEAKAAARNISVELRSSEAVRDGEDETKSAAEGGRRGAVAPPGWQCAVKAGRLMAAYDPRWTQEALVNLLDNAVKYSPPGSTVAVEIRALELFVCICVEDEGTGVPEEERAKIFGRFYRGANAAQIEGCGVGLYLTRMILQKEGGYVRVQPRREGGSSFQMYLPRKQK